MIKRNKKGNMVMVRMTDEMFARVVEISNKEDLPVAEIVRRFLKKILFQK